MLFTTFLLKSLTMICSIVGVSCLIGLKFYKNMSDE